jgi:diguanylate cyclase (GGDEF)-like protein
MSEREKIHVLIVDDKPENLLVLENLLEGPDLKIIKATSGNVALGLLLEHDFALILLDVQMPEMDGFEVAELMRKSEKTKNIPIIFVTALSKEQKFIFKGYEVGAVDYLFKPIEPNILRSKVRIFLELYRQKRQLQEQALELEKKILEITQAQRELEDLNHLLQDLSSLDGLTGILNRRRFDEVLEMEWKRAARSRTNLSLIMIDIDCFKLYNDSYGHLEGDECLKKVAEALGGNLRRAGDVLARYGGEEFAVIMPETDDEGAEVVAERLRLSIQEAGIPHDKSPVIDYVTVSLGTATVIPGTETSPKALIAAADKALYQAKQEGRNRTIRSSAISAG